MSAFGPGLTMRPDRAWGASRRSGGAERCAQFHQSRVEIPGPALWEQLLGPDPELPADARVPWVAFEQVEPRQHAHHVAVEDRRGPIVSQRSDRTSRVAPDAGQAHQYVNIGRNLSAPAFDDFFCRCLEMAGSPIIA